MMGRLIKVWLMLLAFWSAAWAQDPLAELQTGGVAAPTMPVEACYIGAKLAPVPGYIRVTIRNGLCDNEATCRIGHPGESLMIYGIRSYRFDGAARNATWAHKGGIYMVEGLDGYTIARMGISWAGQQGAADSTRVSVLRPGEECMLWLPRPAPGQTGWRIYTRRLTPRSGGSVKTVLDHCVESFDGGIMTLQSCLLRFDTVAYAPPDQYGVEDVVSDGDKRTISRVRTLWSTRKVH